MFFIIVIFLEKFIFLFLIVGFLTLLERKLLGYLQIRKGPNKVSILGLLQPIADAVKLILKEKHTNFFMNILGYFIFPLFILIITIVL